jgi:uncharacterized RDD family membrane protein YckC
VYCSKCGTEISGATSFCPACGQMVGSLAPASAPGAPNTGLAAASPYPASPVVAVYPRVFYAGFWFRFVAYLIDGILRAVAFGFLLILLLALTGAGSAIQGIASGEDISDHIAALIGGGFLAGLFGITLLVSWLYYALFECSSWQATPGKKMLNLYVTDLDGRSVTFARASGRFFARIVSSVVPLFFGYILAGITEKRQALHDIIAGCLVLRKN